VLVLDHHKIAMSEMVGAGENFIDTRTWSEPITWDRHMRNAVQDDMENAHNTIYLLFDMDRSGAGIAWDVLCGGQRPRLIDYVEDRDLWRFNLPGSREVHAACGSYPLTLEDRARLMEREVSDLMEEGFAILRYHDKMVEGAVKHAGRLNIGGHDVPAIACPVIEIASDLGNKLAEGNPFAAVYVDRPDGSRYFQLRSTPAGLDVGEIAQSLGGGGHRNAAGFTLKAEQLSR
jgi:oligoribonuclease NrnB/cAMP/cGMP phosphodiesterase (DHH superfamily)